MERVRQIAATGIDGVYVDIPYWMTHFEGWEDSWASFDDYTVAAFKAKTGLNAKTDLKLGDFRDANFRKWIDFRIDALTDFMRDIDVNAKAVNPNARPSRRSTPASRSLPSGWAAMSTTCTTWLTPSRTSTARAAVRRPHAAGLVSGYGWHVLVPAPSRAASQAGC